MFRFIDDMYFWWLGQKQHSMIINIIINGCVYNMEPVNSSKWIIMQEFSHIIR